MKKIIALAAVSLAVSACDPYEDEPGGTPNVIEVMVVPQTASQGGTIVDDDGTDGWSVTGVQASATNGRMLVVKTDGLLDGSSIEATPQSCVPAGGWLTVTTNATLPAGGQWYTCYNPGTPTALEGASVIIYYSTTAPGVLAAAAPRTAGRMAAGDYNFTGTIQGKNGGDVLIDVDVTAADPVP